MSDHNTFLRKAIELASQGMKTDGGGPFGAVVVKDNKIIGEGRNMVTVESDPTAHAEIVAIRNACSHLNSFQLEDCIIYSSCEPCPMCLGAIYWARPKAVYFASTKSDAARAGFDDKFIYEEMEIPADKRKILTVYQELEEARMIFDKWIENTDKIEY